MQTADIHNRMPPIRQMNETSSPENAAQNERQYKAEKSDSEPVRNGDSFPAMIKKMIAAVKEGKNGDIQKNPGEAVQTETGTRDLRDVSKSVRGENTEYLKNFKETDSESLKTFLKPQEKSLKEGTGSAALKKTNLKEENLKHIALESDENMLKMLLSEEELDIKTLLPENLSDSEEIPLLQNLDSENLKTPEKKKNLSLNEESLLKQNRTVFQAKLNKKEYTDKTEEENIKLKKPVQKSGKPVISVEDLRSVQNLRADASVHETGSGQRVETDNTVDMVIDFRGKAQNLMQGGEKGLQSGETQKTNQSFSAMFAQEIREASQDFVQAGKIVLRDNNAGEIRLQLRPENLGAVKIKLELAEGKKINGTVTVSTKEAFEAFEENLDALAQEFKQNGFEAAEFNLSWSGSSSQNSFAENFDSFGEINYQNIAQNLSTAEKNADNLSTYSYIYGSTVDILI